MVAHKESGGGDKHWRLSPKAMMDLKAIIENSPKPITEQSVIEGLLDTERKGTFLRLSREGLNNSPTFGENRSSLQGDEFDAAFVR